MTDTYKERATMAETIIEPTEAPCGNTPYDEGPFTLDHEARIAHLSKLEPEDMLEELLAVIHGDGGHYSDEHGLPRAVADAEVKWYARGACVADSPLPPSPESKP
jgi:hypothetical protein